MDFPAGVSILCAFTMCVCTCSSVHHIKGGMQLLVRSLSLLFYLSGWTWTLWKQTMTEWHCRFMCFIPCPFKSLCKYLIKGVSAHTTSSVCIFVVVFCPLWVLSICWQSTYWSCSLAGELCSAAHNSDCDPVSLCVFVCLRVCVLSEQSWL